MADKDTKVVQYDNHFNTINVAGLTSSQQNTVYGLIYYAQENGLDKMHTLNVQELAELTYFNGKDNKILFAAINDLARRIHLLDFRQSVNGDFVKCDFFGLFAPDSKEQTLTFAINPYWEYLFKKGYIPQFTNLQLEEHASLPSKYAKELYRQLVQYSSTGVCRIQFEDAFRIFGIKESRGTGELMRKAINPAYEILKNFKRKCGDYEIYVFEDLNYKIEQKGRKYIRIDFFFKKDGQQSPIVEGIVHDNDDKVIKENEYKIRLESSKTAHKDALWTLLEFTDEEIDALYQSFIIALNGRYINPKLKDDLFDKCASYYLSMINATPQKTKTTKFFRLNSDLLHDNAQIIEKALMDKIYTS